MQNKQEAADNFELWARLVQDIAETRGSNAKVELCANYFTHLAPSEVSLACQFMGEGAFSNISGKRASVGARTIGVAAADYCGIDYDIVFKACRTASGSSTETIQRLFENLPEARQKNTLQHWNLARISELAEELAQTRGRKEKQQILTRIWGGLSPLATKYFLRLLSQGSLRIGFESRSVLQALARSSQVDYEQLRYAHMLTGSLAKTAELACMNRLDQAQFKLFNPIAFMLATPLHSRSVDHWQDFIAEEKFDGMRCQLHAHGPKVELFSRDLNAITNQFPELVEIFRIKRFPPTVIDGEICVFRNQTIQPFQELQKRMGVKKPSKELMSKYPVVFIGYDLLYLDQKETVSKSLIQRRISLEKIAKKYEFPISKQHTIYSKDQVDQLFEQALAHGNEGLMLKEKNAPYSFGERKNYWLKVKRPSGSIDTVILYAQAGSGKRGGSYSDFTLGVSVKEDPRYEEEFIPIGKAYGGYTDKEWKDLNKAIKECIIDRFGPTAQLRPEIVVELEFEAIQPNSRTKAKYTLRFPRFKAIRWDLTPKDVDSLEHVEMLFREHQSKERSPQKSSRSFQIPD